MLAEVDFHEPVEPLEELLQLRRAPEGEGLAIRGLVVEGGGAEGRAQRHGLRRQLEADGLAVCRQRGGLGAFGAREHIADLPGTEGDLGERHVCGGGLAFPTLAKKKEPPI